MSITITFPIGYKPVLKHGDHDQSTHGNRDGGSTTTELSDDNIKDVIYNSKTVNDMFQKVAERLGKSMKPSVDNLSEDEITHYRGVRDVSRDAQRLLDGKVKFTEFQTWGQGIYLAEDKDIASNYGTLIGMKLDSSAKIVQGETTWDSAFDVSYENPNARTSNTTTSSFIDLRRIETQINSGKMENLSISDMRNVYWAAKGYDGFTTYGETVLFNGSKLTINKADIGTAVKKHGDHDQSTHGSWATGVGSYHEIELQVNPIQKDYWNKKNELEKYLNSKGIENPSWSDIQNDNKAKKLDEEATALWKKSATIVNKFYEEHLGHPQLQTEKFRELRDKYVVADTPTLKMNRQLREGGGLTQRVKDADKMCETGTVTKDLGVYRGAVLPKETLDNLKVGKTFIDKGFQSVGLNKSLAETYAEIRKKEDGIKGELTLFRMTLKKGLNAVDVGFGEVVVQRNANLTVTGKTKSGKYTIVDVGVSK